MKLRLPIFLLLALCSQVFSADIDPNEIVKKADLRRGLGNVSHSFKASITNQDGRSEVYIVSFKDINASLTLQTEPERARGRKLLTSDYDIWLYSPNTKKPLRISLEQKLSGEVSNGDIVRTNYAADYDATLMKSDKDGDDQPYKLELKAKNKKVTYSRIEYVVNKKDFAPVKATFFALSGKPLKQAQFLDYKPVLGVVRSTKMVIRDYLQKEKVSTLVFSDYKLQKFEDSLFNKESLEF